MAACHRTPGPGRDIRLPDHSRGATTPKKSRSICWRLDVAGTCPTNSGMLNFERIGGWIIEVDRRFSDQWPDLDGHGAGSMRSTALDHRGVREFADRDRRDGYSVVLFGPKGRH